MVYDINYINKNVYAEVYIYDIISSNLRYYIIYLYNLIIPSFETGSNSVYALNLLKLFPFN